MIAKLGGFAAPAQPFKSQRDSAIDTNNCDNWWTNAPNANAGQSQRLLDFFQTIAELCCRVGKPVIECTGKSGIDVQIVGWGIIHLVDQNTHLRHCGLRTKSGARHALMQVQPTASAHQRAGAVAAHPETDAGITLIRHMANAFGIGDDYIHSKILADNNIKPDSVPDR